MAQKKHNVEGVEYVPVKGLFSRAMSDLNCRIFTGKPDPEFNQTFYFHLNSELAKQTYDKSKAAGLNPSLLERTTDIIFQLGMGDQQATMSELLHVYEVVKRNAYMGMPTTNQ